MQSRLCCYLVVILATIFSDVVLVEVTEGPVVRLKDGAVRGLVEEADGGRNVNFFQGIRFGRAERFHKPTPVEPWTGIYEANKIRYSCPQLLDTIMAENETISEDCLFLNVWQPATAEPKSNLSVMVWIYGGGFQGGTIFTKNLFNVKHLSALGNVVAVEINYRLGPLGFASFGTKETPGNLGFHDQILGLKWVQENIRQFGGNPDDVTIFGGSAGSISVGALILSPLTTGLFHRAILQSGAPNLKLLVESRADSLRKTLKFAQRMGCNGTELESAIKCLEEKTPEELVKSTMVDFVNLKSFFPLFGDEVLPVDPLLALERFDRKIDLLFGMSRNEGTAFIGLMFPEIDLVNITLDSAKKGIEQMLVKLKIGTKGLSSVVDHYTKQLTTKSSQDQLRIAVSDVFGDYLLVCPTVLFGQQVARKSVQSNHFYSYRLMTPLKYSFMPQPDWMGVSHGQDSAYIFGLPLTLNGKSSEITKENVQLSRDMIGAWTQFAKTGQIQPVSGSNWTEAIDYRKPEQSSVSYFSLNPTDYRMVNNYWKVTCEQLWKPLLYAQ